jgi:hypothetical protein
MALRFIQAQAAITTTTSRAASPAKAVKSSTCLACSNGYDKSFMHDQRVQSLLLFHACNDHCMNHSSATVMLFV